MLRSKAKNCNQNIKRLVKKKLATLPLHEVRQSLLNLAEYQIKITSSARWNFKLSCSARVKGKPAF